MNNKIFSSGDYYNLFYKDKDYELEAKYISNKIQEYRPGSNSILELGCGTGKHAKELKPSKRGELEITDLLNKYKKKNKLYADYIGRGGAWLDTGSIEDFYKTSAFVSAIENRQGFKIACLEEIAYLKKWIGKKEINNQIKFYGKCEYSKYLEKIKK